MASFALQPGQVVGDRFRLLQMIGAGGMGAVWSARDEQGGRDVALKFLHPSLLRDPMVVQRFFQEGAVGTQLRHPFIIETYGSGRYLPPETKDAIPYLVTELLDGEPLTDALQRTRTIPLAAALEIMRDVAHAAEAAHRAGVLHRDLKPANVFLHRGARGVVTPKVLDFGVSKLMDPALDVGLTTTGVLVGSPAYMSPEQALAKRDIDARSDVWSIGAMLHRCLTGEPLFSVSGKERMLWHIVQVDVSLVGLETLPAPVAALLVGCLKRDREQRFASADALARAIDDVMRQAGLHADLRALLPPESDAQPVVHSPRFEPTEIQTHAPVHTTVAARRPRSPLLLVVGLVGLLGVGALVALALLVRSASSSLAVPTADFQASPAVPAPQPPPPPSSVPATPEAPARASAPSSAPTPPVSPASSPAVTTSPRPKPPRPPDVSRRPGF